MFEKQNSSIFDFVQSNKQENSGSIFDKAQASSPFSSANPFDNSESRTSSFFEKDAKIKSVFDSSSPFDNKSTNPFDGLGNGNTYLNETSTQHMLNVRGSNYGHLSVVDKMRGIQANRLDLDGSVGLAEMYADSSLDNRVMGGMYNVVLSDIYSDRRKFEAAHGLLVDGLITNTESTQLDLDSIKNKEEFSGTIVGEYKTFDEKKQRLEINREETINPLADFTHKATTSNQKLLNKNADDNFIIKQDFSVEIKPEKPKTQLEIAISKDEEQNHLHTIDYQLEKNNDIFNKLSNNTMEEQEINNSNLDKEYSKPIFIPIKNEPIEINQSTLLQNTENLFIKSTEKAVKPAPTVKINKEQLEFEKELITPFANTKNTQPNNRFKEENYLEEQEVLTPLEKKMYPILKTMTILQIRDLIKQIEDKLQNTESLEDTLPLKAKLSVATKFLSHL